MQLPGERMEALLERAQVQIQFLWQTENREVIGATREGLNFSAGGAEMRAACCCIAAPACRGSCHGCRCRTHDLILGAGSSSAGFSLWGLVFASTNLHSLKPALLKKMVGGLPIPANHAIQSI